MNQKQTIRCKFRCDSVTYHRWGDQDRWSAKFFPVTASDAAPENKRFWDSTPGGSFEVQTVKEMPWAPGKEYYLDIVEA